MKQYFLDGNGGMDSLKLSDVVVPTAGKGEVLVRMHAASLNYRDLYVLSGMYSKYAFSVPNTVPLSDGAGEIVAVGEGVSSFSVGDRVCGNFFDSWIGGDMQRADLDSGLGGSLHGVLTEYRVFNQQSLVRIPEHLSYREAATLPCAALTAWNGLHAGPVPVGPGQTVLVLGTGGVAVFAAQFASIAGATVIATSSSEDKLVRMKNLGATHGINYVKTPEWGVVAKEITNGRGVDIVIETGGAGTIRNRSLRLVLAEPSLLLASSHRAPSIQCQSCRVPSPCAAFWLDRYVISKP